MKIKVIASGSKGNCTYIECGTTKILIDAGINYLQIKRALEECNVDINDIDLVLLTHIHNDHIKGLATLLKKTSATLCTHSTVYEELRKKIEISKFHMLDYEYSYKDVEIELFALSHDVSCYGYIISYDKKEIVYITDTGYLNKKYYPKIKNKDVYIIEANHDEKMLMNGPYPYILKQRIVGDNGHLSNNTTGYILSKILGKNTKCVFLAHISEHNNTKELALKQVKKQLKENNVDFDNFVITDQYVALDMVEV